jgi:hypothetical protein
MAIRAIGSRSGTTKFTSEDRAVTNSVTVTDGDFVKLASGRVTNATIGTGKLYGVVEGGPNSNLVSRTYRTPTSTGDSGGTVTVLVQLVEDQIFRLPVSAALASDAEGSYYNLTGSTGAQQVDNTSKSAATGQLLCLKRVADSAGAYTLGDFTVAALATDGNTLA